MFPPQNPDIIAWFREQVARSPIAGIDLIPLAENNRGWTVTQDPTEPFVARAGEDGMYTVSMQRTRYKDGRSPDDRLRIDSPYGTAEIHGVIVLEYMIAGGELLLHVQAKAEGGNRPENGFVSVSASFQAARQYVMKHPEQIKNSHLFDAQHFGVPIQQDAGMLRKINGHAAIERTQPWDHLEEGCYIATLDQIRELSAIPGAVTEHFFQALGVLAMDVLPRLLPKKMR